eukprot:scaffold5783_cov129-Amphora_coffeaeformis.AAC.19
MKLNHRIKNLFPNKREGSVSESNHGSERYGSIRSWKGRKAYQNNSTRSTKQSFPGSPLHSSSKESSTTLPPRHRTQQKSNDAGNANNKNNNGKSKQAKSSTATTATITTTTTTNTTPTTPTTTSSHISDILDDKTLENMSPEERRILFAHKLKNLGRHLIDDNQQASEASPMELGDMHSRTTPRAGAITPMSEPHRPPRSSTAAGRSAKQKMMTRSRSDGKVTNFANPPMATLLSSAFTGLSILGDNATETTTDNTPTRHKKVRPATKMAAVRSSNTCDDDDDDDDDECTFTTMDDDDDQDAFTTLKPTDETYDSNTLGSKTMDYTMDQTMDGTVEVAKAGAGACGGGRTAFNRCSPSMETMGTGFYTQNEDGQTTTVCTDARTAATESSHYTHRDWYNVLFSCGLNSPEQATVDRETFATIHEKNETTVGEEEERFRAPMNPCVAPCGINRQTGASSNTRLAAFLSPSQDSDEKRSNNSPRSTRFAANDERQTSFASSSSGSSSSNSSQTPTESTMSSYEKYASARRSFDLKNQDPTCYHDNRLRKNDLFAKKESKSKQPMFIQTTTRYADPYLDAYKPMNAPLFPNKPSDNKNKTSHNQKQLGREIEFLTSDYGGHKSSIPLNTPIRTEPNWFLKRAAAGLIRRHKPVKAVDVPVPLQPQQQQQQPPTDDDNEDNSTISTKFSLTATMATMHN